MRRFRFTAVFACIASLTLLLSACLVVHDFGGFWESSKPDPALSGKWTNARAGGTDLEFVPTGNDFRMRFLSQVSDTESEKLARTLTLGKNTFLMTKRSKSDEGGDLIPYVVQGDTLVMFSANRDKRADFLKKYPTIPFSVTKTSITIEKLTPETMRWLEQISSEPEWWSEMQRLTRAVVE